MILIDLGLMVIRRTPVVGAVAEHVGLVPSWLDIEAARLTDWYGTEGVAYLCQQMAVTTAQDIVVNEQARMHLQGEL